MSALERAEPVMVPDEKTDLLKRTLGADLTDLELELFAHRANQSGLDPFSHQLWAIKRKGRMILQTGIDGYRLIAERSGRYAGQDGPWWCNATGEWSEVWLEAGPPTAARIVVKKSLDNGTLGTFPAVGMWREYAPENWEKAPEAFMWRDMPASQLAKCTEALALRKAFPADLSGLYVREEMDQAAPMESSTGPRLAPRDEPGVEPERIGQLHAALAALADDDRAELRAAWRELGGPNLDGPYFTVRDAALLNRLITEIAAREAPSLATSTGSGTAPPEPATQPEWKPGEEPFDE